MKHAYLIIAHKSAEQLQRLLEAIDYPNNDIYIHLDKRFNEVDAESLKAVCHHSAVNVVSIYEPNWGTFETVSTELKLLQAATSSFHYGYYHLLSGQDLPLKSQEEIHAYFNASGCEFVHFCKPEEWNRVVYDRLAVKRFPHFASKGNLPEKIERRLSSLKKRLGFNRLDSDVKYGFGANWFSVTDNLASQLVSHADWIERHFSHGICTDELFLQSFILSFGFDKDLAIPIGDGSYRSCARYIDWSQGGKHPKTWSSADYERLILSDFLFARKFDYNHDPDLIDAIVEKVKYKSL